MSLPPPVTNNMKHKTSRTDDKQQSSSSQCEAMGKRSKVPATHLADLPQMEDFILYPEGMIDMHRSDDQNNEAYALRERQFPRSSLSQQAAVHKAETAQSQARLRDHTKSRHRNDARDATDYRDEDKRWRGQGLPAAPMPPRLNTPELEEPVGEFWPHHLLLEKQAEAYIALRKSQQDTGFCAKKGKEIMCCTSANSRQGSQRNRLRHTKDRR